MHEPKSDKAHDEVERRQKAALTFSLEFYQLSAVAAPDLTAIIEYLNRVPGTVAAYLFGSLARNRASSDSDMDLAVLFDPEKIPDPQALLEMKSDLESLTRREVDLVVLNRANPILKHQIYKHGKIFLDRFPAVSRKLWVKSLMEYDDLKKIRSPIEKSLAKGISHG